MLIGGRAGLFRVRVGSHLGDEHGVGRDRRAAPPHAVRVDAALGERDAHLVRVRVGVRVRVRVRVRVGVGLGLRLGSGLGLGLGLGLALTLALTLKP